ncbi:di-heme oxidoredictase family protein [Pyxidicoccus sp. 3LFB2]
MIDSALTQAGTAGVTLSYQITATHSPTAYDALNLPAGLNVDRTSGRISGAPAGAGTTRATISATNSSGTDSKALVFTIAEAGAPPSITSPLTQGGTVGTSLSYFITASNAPSSYAATGLPAGLSVNPASGEISGTPTAAGTSSVVISATNASSTDSKTLVFTIAEAAAPPSITSALTQSGTVGMALSYSITASNAPSSYAATGLPAGLSVNPVSGEISGTPTAAGTTSAIISATNAVGTDSKTLVFTINPLGTNLAVGKVYSASNAQNATNTPNKACDGNLGTRWESTPTDPGWLWVDLLQSYAISTVVLRWEAAYGRDYKIQLSNDLTTWTDVAAVTGGSGGVATHAVSGTGRYVRMHGTARGTSGGYSLWEFEVYGSTVPSTPAVPAGLVATADSESQVTVSWSAVPGATGYDLQRDGVTVSSVTSPHVHSGLTAGSTHTYAVRATNAAGASAFSATVTATTHAAPTVPAVPTGLVATAGSESQLTISWNAVPGATGYDLQRDGVTVTRVTSPHAHSGLAASSTHTYAVRATNTAGASAFSATVTATTLAAGSGPVPLFDATTVLEPAMVEDTPTALITRFGDRARDRHAREAEFHIYDHYLTFYWEQRTAKIEIVDRVAKGGTEIEFNINPEWPLEAPEFRAIFRGITTKAEYFLNLSATRLDPLHYRATISHNPKENRPLRIGDRVEIEVSQFLQAPTNGRANYYGTTVLYVVGSGGLVPWYGQGPVLPSGAQDSFPLPQSAWMGGRATLPYQYSNEPQHRFKQIAGHMSENSVQPFMLGRRLHHTDFGDGSHEEPGNPLFTAQAGKLGSSFVARSCVACHANNGRALPPAVGAPMLDSVVRVGSDATGTPHPDLGRYLQPQVTSGVAEGGAYLSGYTTTNGTYGDGTPYSLRKPSYTFTGLVPSFYSVRLAPQLVGLGLLEAVREDAVAALADPDDANGDGISGRMQVVIDPQTGAQRLGRLGYKAGQARVTHQLASALVNDMGVTTSIFPNVDRGSSQSAPGPSTELSDADLALLYRYIATLGVAARRDLTDPEALQGETLFTSAGCAQCHAPTMTTSPYHPLAELRGQTIHPYTDLLLHDMGPGLADSLSEWTASGAEWRTPPLWSIGLTAGVSGGEAYLHDGRARSLSEAILWHGGEAEASKEAFRTMSSTDRAALLEFLQSL